MPAFPYSLNHYSVTWCPKCNHFRFWLTPITPTCARTSTSLSNDKAPLLESKLFTAHARTVPHRSEILIDSLRRSSPAQRLSRDLSRGILAIGTQHSMSTLVVCWSCRLVSITIIISYSTTQFTEKKNKCLVLWFNLTASSKNAGHRFRTWSTASRRPFSRSRAFVWEALSTPRSVSSHRSFSFLAILRRSLRVTLVVSFRLCCLFVVVSVVFVCAR